MLFQNKSAEVGRRHVSENPHVRSAACLTDIHLYVRSHVSTVNMEKKITFPPTLTIVVLSDTL